MKVITSVCCEIKGHSIAPNDGCHEVTTKSNDEDKVMSYSVWHKSLSLLSLSPSFNVLKICSVIILILCLALLLSLYHFVDVYNILGQGAMPLEMTELFHYPFIFIRLRYRLDLRVERSAFAMSSNNDETTTAHHFNRTLCGQRAGTHTSLCYRAHIAYDDT